MMDWQQQAFLIEQAEFPQLFTVLMKMGYQIVGPTIREGAIIYDQLSQVTELPIGWTEEQQAGSYRLKPRNDRAYFGYTVGPHSWKKFLHLPIMKLWQAERRGNGFEFVPLQPQIPKLAFLGVRACELHAIAIQDKLFLQGEYVDPSYAARREQVFTIAINCTQSANICFCVSMQTGPAVTQGYDLTLTEVLTATRHYFLMRVGSAQGAEVLAQITHQTASETESELASKLVKQTATQMQRTMDTTNIKELLYHNYEHPRWDEVAARCLTCGNCTMVCPTCFCTTVEDVTDLTGEHAERWRKWDSCFTMDFSYIHGGTVRASTKARYRQWMTHKLATWIDQFGSSGCVGCGRCISWCPVGIDITAEVGAIREPSKEGNGNGNSIT